MKTMEDKIQKVMKIYKERQAAEQIFMAEMKTLEVKPNQAKTEAINPEKENKEKK